MRNESIADWEEVGGGQWSVEGERAERRNKEIADGRFQISNCRLKIASGLMPVIRNLKFEIRDRKSSLIPRRARLYWPLSTDY
jgi:hypothetical protein